MAMIFLPNMSQLKLELPQIAPNKTAIEVLEKLKQKIQQVSESVLDINGNQFNLSNYHLVDTNMESVSDLSWYMTLPPEQLALFIMHNDQFKQGKAQKSASPDGFKFNVFVQQLIQQQQAKKTQSQSSNKQNDNIQKEISQGSNTRAEVRKVSEDVVMSEDDDTSSEKGDKEEQKNTKQTRNKRQPHPREFQMQQANEIAKQHSNVPYDETPTNIENLLEYIRTNSEMVATIAKSTNLNFNLIRLMKHQLSKVEKNDLNVQPFSFLRPLDRVKKYDYSAAKIFTANNNQTLEFDQTPEQILKSIFVDPLLNPKTSEQYQNTSFEERLDQALNSIYGIKMSYPKLLALYKMFNVPKEKYRPLQELQIEANDKQSGEMVLNAQRTNKQIKKLMCLHFADCKMKGHRLIYVDVVQASLHELHLLLRSFRDQSQVLLLQQKENSSAEHLWLMAAIDSEVGIIGYQIMYKMPTGDEMAELVVKIDKKLNKLGKTASGARSMFDEQKKEPTRWLIVPDNSATNPRLFNEALTNANMRAVLLPSDELNQTLNNCRALWPYIAQVWESKVLSGTLQQALTKQTQKTEAFKSMLMSCFCDLNRYNVKALASSFNNQRILKELSERVYSSGSDKPEGNVLNKPKTYKKGVQAEKNIAFEFF